MIRRSRGSQKQSRDNWDEVNLEDEVEMNGLDDDEGEDQTSLISRKKQNGAKRAAKPLKQGISAGRSSNGHSSDHLRLPIGEINDAGEQSTALNGRDDETLIAGSDAYASESTPNRNEEDDDETLIRNDATTERQQSKERLKSWLSKLECIVLACIYMTLVS